MIARPLRDIERLASSDRELYPTYYGLTRAEVRASFGDKWDVEAFLAETPRRLERLREALGEADARELAFVAHSLKGSCGQIGALRLAALSAELENAGRHGCLEAAPALLAGLERELSRVAPLLERRASSVEWPPWNPA